MARLAVRFPHYGWERNAGYGTPAHCQAMAAVGVTWHHRRAFAPVRALLQDTILLDGLGAPPPMPPLGAPAAWDVSLGEDCPLADDVEASEAAAAALRQNALAL
jgi:hypothetical protein